MDKTELTTHYMFVQPNHFPSPNLLYYVHKVSLYFSQHKDDLTMETIITVKYITCIDKSGCGLSHDIMVWSFLPLPHSSE